MKIRVLSAVVALLLPGLVVAEAAGELLGSSPLRTISTNTSGVALNAESTAPSISGDGRYVAFTTAADNIGVPDAERTSPSSHGPSDVVVKDIVTGSLIVASVTSAGATGNDASVNKSISRDGRWLAFDSSASDLVEGDSNGRSDVFVRDLLMGTTEAISDVTGLGGTLMFAEGSDSISADGQIVVYQQEYMAGGTWRFRVVVHDSWVGSERYFDYQPGEGWDLTPDGRWLALTTRNPCSCSPSDNPTVLIDLSTGDVARLSPADPVASDRNPSLSDDGQTVAILSSAPLLPSDTDSRADVYVLDRVSGAVQLAGLYPDGTLPESPDETPTLTADGALVAWMGEGSLAGGQSGDNEILVQELATGRQVAVSLNPSGGPTLGPWGGTISANGTRVAFNGADHSGPSTASWEVYVADLEFSPTENTPSGEEVIVEPTDDSGNTLASLTFNQVDSGGTTTVTVVDPETALPSGFQAFGRFLEIQTTAIYTGFIVVCIEYEGDPADPSSLRLMHYDSQVESWIDITSTQYSRPNSLCGVTTSLSPFVVVGPQYQWSGFFPPVDNPGADLTRPVLNRMRAGASVPVKFSLGGFRGLDVFAPEAPSSQAVACLGGSVDQIEETTTSSSSDLSYDHSLDHYVYVWKTNKAWAGTCRRLIVRFDDGTSHSAYFQFAR